MGQNDEMRRLLIERTSETDGIICVIEEMSELTKVLTKRMRRSPKFNYQDLTMELAHVQLMCEVVRANFKIPVRDIDEAEYYALKKALDERSRSFLVDKDAVLFGRHILDDRVSLQRDLFTEKDPYAKKLSEANKIINDADLPIGCSREKFEEFSANLPGLKKMTLPEPNITADRILIIKEDIAGLSQRQLDSLGVKIIPVMDKYPAGLIATPEEVQKLKQRHIDDLDDLKCSDIIPIKSVDAHIPSREIPGSFIADRLEKLIEEQVEDF